MWAIREGGALDRLREMPDESVRCCVTSPPYFGLRDYGTGEWHGGDASCDHIAPPRSAATMRFRGVCGKCGARRVDEQIGLEATPDEFVGRIVDVFREVRRVLSSDGTLWLNMGDSYAGSWGAQSWGATTALSTRTSAAQIKAHPRMANTGSIPVGATYKAKDLLMIPATVALALRADGWYLRSDIIWAKPNPMPESVTDRPTSAHEHLFLLARSARYFYDADAIREADAGTDHPRSVLDGQPSLEPTNGLRAPHKGLRQTEGRNGAGRNKRNVWEIATQPYAGAHFATFPPKLVLPCILAGSREGDTILDPFAGAGTTGVVALRLGRSFLGVELNPAYAELGRERIRRDAPFLNVPAEVAAA